MSYWRALAEVEQVVDADLRERLIEALDTIEGFQEELEKEREHEGCRPEEDYYEAVRQAEEAEERAGVAEQRLAKMQDLLDAQSSLREERDRLAEENEELKIENNRLAHGEKLPRKRAKPKLVLITQKARYKVVV